MIKAAVKYGGCQPTYDRVAFCRRIKEALASRLRWVGLDERMDILFIINGCPRACAEREEVLSLCERRVVITGEIDELPLPCGNGE